MKVELDIPDELLSQWLAMTVELGGSVRPVSAVPFHQDAGRWRVGGSTLKSYLGLKYIQRAIRDGRVSTLDLTGDLDPALSSNKANAAIRRALAVLTKYEPELALHLTESLIVGHYVTYTGDLHWDLDEPEYKSSTN